MRGTGAGGTVRDPDAWPRMPVAIPRGPAEIAWHALLVTSTAAVLLAPAVRLLALVAVIALVAARRSIDWGRAHRSLAKAAVLGNVAFAAHASARGGRWGWPRLWWHVLTGQVHIGHDGPVTVLAMLDLSTYLGVAGTIVYLYVALLLAFDRRRVDRDLVDPRVWQRQQRRRIQLLRADHQRRTPPEVR
jgi:hypothetical protein